MDEEPAVAESVLEVPYLGWIVLFAGALIILCDLTQRCRTDHQCRLQAMLKEREERWRA
jgi:hypothetical protein